MKSIKKVKYNPEQIQSIVDMFRSESEGDFELGAELLSRCIIDDIPKDILGYLTVIMGSKLNRESIVYIAHERKRFTTIQYLMTLSTRDRLELYLMIHREKYNKEVIA
jgi:hypothetical protein